MCSFVNTNAALSLNTEYVRTFTAINVLRPTRPKGRHVCKRRDLLTMNASRKKHRTNLVDVPLFSNNRQSTCKCLIKGILVSRYKDILSIFQNCTYFILPQVYYYLIIH